jgi:hypothetical protein
VSLLCLRRLNTFCPTPAKNPPRSFSCRRRCSASSRAIVSAPTSSVSPSESPISFITFVFTAAPLGRARMFRSHKCCSPISFSAFSWICLLWEMESWASVVGAFSMTCLSTSSATSTRLALMKEPRRARRPGCIVGLLLPRRVGLKVGISRARRSLRTLTSVLALGENNLSSLVDLLALSYRSHPVSSIDRVGGPAAVRSLCERGLREEWLVVRA